MSKLEKFFVAFFFIIALAAFQYVSKLNYYVSQLDSANMVENINAINFKGAPSSQINRSVNDALASVITQTANDVCSQPLISSNTESTKIFDRHAYAALYILAPFRSVFSSPSIAAFAHAIGFIGLLFSIYFFLRGKNLPIIATLAFGMMVAAHPAWSASVFGQFYSDRIFLFAGYLYVVLVHQQLTKKSDHTGYILILAVLTSLIHERAALMVGGFTLVSLLLYRGWTDWSRKDVPLIAVAICTLSYAIGYLTLFNHNSDYGSFSSALVSFTDTLSNNEVFRFNLEKFLIVNLGFLILAVFEWRLALIAFGAMLPNIIGTIGGAEKTGWSTHYHSTYFPFLVAAASIGSIRLWQVIQARSIRWVIVVPFAVIGTFLALLDPDSLSPLVKLKSSNLANNAWVKVIGVLTNSGDGVGIKNSADFRRRIAGEVPNGAVVTTFEGMFPALIGGGRILHYYPLGLGNANYAVLPYTMDNQGVMQLSGAVTYLGSKNLSELDSCLNTRIRDAGYKVVKMFSMLPDNRAGTVILKRDGI